MIKFDKRIFKGLLAFIVTLALLFSGQALWQNYAVMGPLHKTLNNITSVKKVVIKPGSKLTEPVQIQVALGNVDNLQKKYEEIGKKVEDALGERDTKLTLADSRTPELEALYGSLQFYVQQALVDGSFPLLDEKVAEKSHYANAAGKVQVDRDHVYITLIKGNHSLYEVIQRNPETKEAL